MSAEANIIVGLDFRQALAEAKAAGPKISEALKIQPQTQGVADAIQKGIVTPSSNARMAVLSASQAISDATVVNADFGSIARAAGNNIDFMAQNLMNLANEVKRNGSTMGRELLNVIKGPSGILIGVSLLVSSLQVLPRLFGDVDTSAQKAAEGGLKAYAERLEGMAEGDIVEAARRVEQRKKMLEVQRDELQRQLETSVLAGSGEPAGIQSSIDELQKRIGILDDFLDKNREQIALAKEMKLMQAEAGGALGPGAFDAQLQQQQIEAMKDGIDKQIAEENRRYDNTKKNIEKTITNELARAKILEEAEKEHVRRLKEIRKPLEDARVLMSGMSLSEQFKALGMSGEDLQRVMKYDRSGFVNQIAELKKMREMVARSDLSADKKFSVIKDIENEIKQIEQKKIESEQRIAELRTNLIATEEERELQSIRDKYDEKIRIAELEKRTAEEITLLRQNKDAEVERKRLEYAEKRKREEEKNARDQMQLERELSQLRVYAGENELQVKLNHVRREYDERRDKIRELLKDRKITLDEEQRLLRGLANAELRERERVIRQQHLAMVNEWKETHTAGMLAINSLNAGVKGLWNTFVVGNRQAKDEMDAVWLAVRNTALNALGDIIAKYIEDAIITRAIAASNSAAQIAEMTAVAAAAAPAALAVNIASFGAAGVAAAGTFATASGSLAAAMSALKIVAAEKGALIDKEQLVLAGEGGKRELIAPVTNFEQFAVTELLPNVLAMVAREGIKLSNYSSNKGATKYIAPIYIGEREIGELVLDVMGKAVYRRKL